MPSKQLPIAIKHPLVQALLNGQISLNEKTALMLRPYLAKLALRVKEAEAVQDAVSAVHLYALWKSDQTLAAVAALRDLRSPFSPNDDLDALEEALRQHYLETMKHIADRGIERIMEQFDS